MDRVIVHVDLDAFYASVEQLDNPELKGKPVIVGGSYERGVVSTCSYEARAYGVRSAMAGFIAKQLCPDGIFVPVRMERYQEVSREVFRVLHSLCDKVEKVSVDEAYMDFSQSELSSGEIINNIKRLVFEETGLSISVGVSYNKFLAKLASEWNKPGGSMVITEDMVPDVLMPYDIGKIHGIGKKSVEKFNRIGIFKVRDLFKLDKEFLIDFLGIQGEEIYSRIRGIDDRDIVTERERKSYGRETTLDHDTFDTIKLKIIIAKFAKEISDSMKKYGVKGRTVTLKIKNSKFVTNTRSRSLEKYTDDSKEISKLCSQLLDEYNYTEPIRLIGISVSNLEHSDQLQISFFD